MMEINWSLVIDIAMPLMTLFGGIWATHFFESRPNLIAHIGFISSHKLPPAGEGEPQFVANSHSVILKNTGRSAAKNVRLGYNESPHLSVNVYPDIDYQIEELPGGSKEIVIPTLIQKKELTISFLYFSPTIWTQVNTHIQSDSGVAKVISMQLQRRPNSWLVRFLLLLIAIGSLTALYFISLLLKWIVGIG